MSSVDKVAKLQKQITKDLGKIDTTRAKSGDNDLYNQQQLSLETLLLKTMNVSRVDVDLHQWKNEYKYLHRQLLDAAKSHRETFKQKRGVLKDLKRLQKEQKKQVLSNITLKFDSAKVQLFKPDSDVNQLKLDIIQNDLNNGQDLTTVDLEHILSLITKQSLIQPQMLDNPIINNNSVGTYKLDNKTCLPILHTFTNPSDLRKKLSTFSNLTNIDNYSNPNHSSKWDCFELIQLICNNTNDYNQCLYLLESNPNWIRKDNIWVNNELRSRLRELFLSPIYEHKLCPISIRKFYSDTYFGGKYSLYGKNIIKLKSICYRSIVESFRDEAFISKINKNDCNFINNICNNFIIFDPFAGTGNWAMLLSNLINAKKTFLWELEKNIYNTIIENNGERINNGVLEVFNHTFEIVPEVVINEVNDEEKEKESGVLILLSPPWGKAFKPGIGIDLTMGLFPISYLLSFYEQVLGDNVRKVFIVQVDKNISNFGDILDKYKVLLRNEQLLMLERK